MSRSISKCWLVISFPSSHRFTVKCCDLNHIADHLVTSVSSNHQPATANSPTSNWSLIISWSLGDECFIESLTINCLLTNQQLLIQHHHSSPTNNCSFTNQQLHNHHQMIDWWWDETLIEQPATAHWATSNCSFNEETLIHQPATAYWAISNWWFWRNTHSPTSNWSLSIIHSIT